MCDIRRTRATSPRPQWGRLYAILPLTVGAFVLVQFSAAMPTVRVLLRYGIAGAAWGAIGWWVRANRVALDQLEWCDCASRAVTRRVIESRAAYSSRAGAEGIDVRVGDAGPTREEAQEALVTRYT